MARHGASRLNRPHYRGIATESFSSREQSHADWLATTRRHRPSDNQQAGSAERRLRAPARGRSRQLPAPAPFADQPASACATHVPHAGVPRGQPRSLTGASPPLTRTIIRAGQPSFLATELPSWSCGFDSRHPLSFVAAHKHDSIFFLLLPWHLIGSCARCVPDGLAALPGFLVQVVAVSASSPPMSPQVKMLLGASGQHTARLPRSCHSWCFISRQLGRSGCV